MSSSSQPPLGAQQAGRGRVRLLGARLAGEPEAEQVGDQQGGVGELEEVRRLGGELVQRVEREELQPVAGVELGVRHPLVHAVDAALGAGVAVVERVAEQAPVPEQAVVDRPRVHADAADRRARRGTPRAGRSSRRRRARGCSSAGRRRSAPGRSGSARPRSPRACRGRRGRHDPPARRAEVDRRDRVRCSRHVTARHRSPRAVDTRRSPSAERRPLRQSSGERRVAWHRADGAHRRNAAATPESTGMCRPVVRVSSGPVST